nr:MAG TPA: hypothetical protein [Caudoviricetes sp.]
MYSLFLPLRSIRLLWQKTKCRHTCHLPQPL